MRLKLIASFILIVLVTTGIIIIVTLQQTAHEVQNFMFRGGLTGSEQVVVALEEYYKVHQSWEGVEDVLRLSPQTPLGIFGRQMARNQGQNLDVPRLHLRLADAEGNLLARTQDSATVSNERLTQNDLTRAIPLEVGNETVGYLLTEGNLVFTTANQVSLVSRLNRAAIIAVAVAGSAAVLLALLLSFSLVRPVRALTQAASIIATGDLSHRVTVKGKDELATLGRTFNHMAESLQQAEASRRAMTADIAHELRTPLAVQRAHLEAIEDGVYPLTQESLTTIEEQNRLLTRMVEDLRTLALADAGQLELQTTPTDFRDLVIQAAARFEPQAAARQIEFQLSLGDNCPTLLVDPQRIQQILHNLIGNALRYSPVGGCITLALDLHPDQVSLSVSDNGPGIPEDALPRVFDRFYRADKSRTRTEGGTGLGLSIARKLAQAHGGDLTVANHPEGGAVFTLSLPV
jgi:two-component system sensor histidine kinase BaeS